MITLLMPTMNRPIHVRRALEYYKKIGIPARLIILDSSSKIIKEENQITIKDLTTTDFAPLYIECEETISYMEKIVKGLSSIYTPYVALAADDDFFSAQGLHEAANFLRDNQDYLFAQGHWLGFTYDTNITWYDVGVLDNIRSFDQKDSLERVRDFLQKNTIIFYSLFRVDAFVDIMKKSCKYAQCGKFFECLYILFTLMRGRGKLLEIPYLYREMMEHSMGRQLQRSWMLGSEFNIAIQKFSAGIADGLVSYCGFNREKSLTQSKIMKDQFLDLVLKTSFSYEKVELPSLTRRLARTFISRSKRDYLLHLSSKYKSIIKTFFNNKYFRDYFSRDPYKKEIAFIEQQIKQSNAPACMFDTSMFTRIFL